MSQVGESLPMPSFWVNRVPESVYSADPSVSLRSEFEMIFKVYDENVQFNYLKSFNRVRVTFSSVDKAEQAREMLNSCRFQGNNLKVRPVIPIKIGEATLGVPAKTKQFLISPPASPPVGWEQTAEAQPCACVDFSLVTALASLQLPGDSHEVHEGSDSTPSIFVVTPDEGEGNHTPSILKDQEDRECIRMSALPRSTVQTSRPPLKL